MFDTPYTSATQTMGSRMKNLLFTLGCLLLSGCGMQRQLVHLDLPAAHINHSDGTPIVLSAVTDSRPPLSGIAPGDIANNVGGVVRGGSGVAVYLENVTVAARTRDIVTQALSSVGFKVVTDEDASPDTPRVSVDITRFAATMPFQFWHAVVYSQRMYADITTVVTVRHGRNLKTFTATGHGENVFQRVVAENWQIALDKAVADFTNQFEMKMVGAGLN